MEDLTHLFKGGPISALAPTSQMATNTVSDPARAMTAPGGASEAVQPGDIRTPAIDAASYDTPVLIDPGGAKRTADNADRRVMLRRGEWNNLP